MKSDSLLTGILHRFYDLAGRNAAPFLVIFYIVGTVGTINPLSRPFFLILFPFAILLSFAFLLAYPGYKTDVKTWLMVVLIAIAGYAIEVAGVNTGVVFGRYSYGHTFGLKVFETPLLIGINWALLVFASASVAEKLNIPPVIKIFIASLIMLFYDLFLEVSAGKLDMWTWEGGRVPLLNYLAWFVTALAMHSLLRLFGLKPSFRLALPVLACQTLFFILLAIYFNFAK